MPHKPVIYLLMMASVLPEFHSAVQRGVQFAHYLALVQCLLGFTARVPTQSPWGQRRSAVSASQDVREALSAWLIY
jgi:hypothetical protein